MNKDIIQIATLVAFGKANLAGKKLQLKKNNPGVYNYRNMLFTCKVSSSHQLLAQDIIAKDPNLWYQFLIKKMPSTIFLSYDPASKLTLSNDYKYLFSTKGDSWHIFVEKDSKYDVWQSKVVAEQGEIKSYYNLFVKGMSIEKIHLPSLETSTQYLKAILNDLIIFATRNNLANWVDVFQSALNKFAITNHLELLQEELLPANCYSLEAKQVLAACDQAWVFGGMGSWNDISHIDDYDLYQRLTTNLYDTICHSIAAAINSFP